MVCKFCVVTFQQVACLHQFGCEGTVVTNENFLFVYQHDTVVGVSFLTGGNFNKLLFSRWSRLSWSDTANSKSSCTKDHAFLNFTTVQSTYLDEASLDEVFRCVVWELFCGNFGGSLSKLDTLCLHHCVDQSLCTLERQTGLDLEQCWSLLVTFLVGNILDCALDCLTSNFGIHIQVQVQALTTNCDDCKVITTVVEFCTWPTYTKLNLFVGESMVCKFCIVAFQKVACLHKLGSKRTVVTNENFVVVDVHNAFVRLNFRLGNFHNWFWLWFWLWSLFSWVAKNKACCAKDVAIFDWATIQCTNTDETCFDEIFRCVVWVGFGRDCTTWCNVVDCQCFHHFVKQSFCFAQGKWGLNLEQCWNVLETLFVRYILDFALDCLTSNFWIESQVNVHCFTFYKQCSNLVSTATDFSARPAQLYLYLLVGKCMVNKFSVVALELFGGLHKFGLEGTLVTYKHLLTLENHHTLVSFVFCLGNSSNHRLRLFYWSRLYDCFNNRLNYWFCNRFFDGGSTRDDVLFFRANKNFWLERFSHLFWLVSLCLLWLIVGLFLWPNEHCYKCYKRCN